LDSIDNARFVAGAILNDRYRIVGLLGKGGMGEVYRADDLKLSQPVALKFLPDHLLSDGAALARFHREVRVARQVSHKNVCRVYDIGEVDGRHFLSMEYIKGEELSSLLRRIGRLPVDKASQLARQMCAGLAAAHDAGVLHRDLKPSNVMIDGDGNARILDFGLAGLTDEFADDELTAGTPAYMAPEQLEGKDCTVASDVYSLGLVLYELFTAKRAFTATTLGELIKLRRSDATPTTPTSIIPDLDPLIERVIERCLQRNPADRPSSALQVAAALPGGDPIAAALAAGETPSPEMVAAAPKKGTLRPAVAMGLLASMIVFIVLAMLLSKQAALHRYLPLTKSPELLREQGSQLVKSFGYTQDPADVATGFEGDPEYLAYLRDNQRTIDAWQTLRSPKPPLIRFWYRQSGGLLVPFSQQRVEFWDPPRDIPGMVNVALDTEGKLFYLEVVPDQVASQSPAIAGATDSNSATGVVAWPTLFAAAGLDFARFKAVESQWTPPHAYDARQAWSGSLANLPDIPIRIEAASFHGKPVYFEMVFPWTAPVTEFTDTNSASQKVAAWTLLAVFFGTLVLGALLALRNLRSGRCDRRGAFRLALVVFALRMTVWLFETHHIAQNRELMLLLTGIQSGLFWSCFVGVMYLALEPYLRKRWPERIISWNRLLAGDFRDPLVGRDILIGAASGAFCVALMYFRLALPRWLSLSPGLPDVVAGYKFGLSGTSAFAQMFSNQLSGSIGLAFIIIFLLLFLSLLFRKDWLGISIGSLIFLIVLVAPTLSDEHWIGSICTGIVVLTFVGCGLRFGPLALMSTLMVFHLWVFYPITTDFGAWYAGSFILGTSILLALAIYGFYISLAGQPLWGGKFLDHD
jgi:serine/threonine-protein kinase